MEKIERAERNDIFDTTVEKQQWGSFNWEHINIKKKKIKKEKRKIASENKPKKLKWNKYIISIVFLRKFNLLQFHSYAAYQRLISE